MSEDRLHRLVDGGLHPFGILAARRGEGGLTAAAALHELRSLTDRLARMAAARDDRFAEGHRQARLTLLHRTRHEEQLRSTGAQIVEMVKDRNDLDAIKLVLGDAILFQTGKSNLSSSATAALSRVAYNLKQFPDTDITVVGYTDNTGSEQLNQTLSEQRAQSVVNYLESQGVPASRLKAVGMGESDPIASNSTVEGRAQNRRVEMFITADQNMISNAQQGR